MKKEVGISFFVGFLTVGTLFVPAAFGAGGNMPEEFVVTPINLIDPSSGKMERLIYAIPDTENIGKIFLNGGYRLVKKFPPQIITGSDGLPNYAQRFMLVKGDKPPLPVVALSFAQVLDPVTKSNYIGLPGAMPPHLKGLRTVSILVLPQHYTTEKTLAKALDRPTKIDPLVKNYYSNFSTQPAAKTKAAVKIKKVDQYLRPFSYSSDIHKKMMRDLVSSGFRDVTDSAASLFNTSTSGVKQLFFENRSGDVKLIMSTDMGQGTEHVTIVDKASTVATLDEKAAALRAIFHALSIH